MSGARLVKVGTKESFPLGFEPVTVGRHSDNSVILADQQVSRHHAEIVMQAGRWVVRDLGSANGTHVNGQKIEQPRVLGPGDTVRFGQTTFRVELPMRAADRDTLVERIPAPVPVPPVASATQQRSRGLWLVVALLAIVLLAVIAVGVLVLWPQGEGDVAQQATATPLVVTVAADVPTETAVLPTDTFPPPTPQPTDTTVPTALPPTPEPSLTPTDLPPPPTNTPAPKPVIGYFRADQPVIEPGQCARLEWGQVENATSVMLGDVGRVNFSGKLDVCLDDSKTYTLQAQGAGGTTEKSLEIRVEAPVGPVIEYFRAVPSILSPGDCALLEWGRVDNATSAKIDPGIGGVGTPGSQEVCPGETTTYVLTAENDTESAIAETTLIVSSGADQKPVIPFFTANPSSIRAGECTLLSWGKVEYATSVVIDNGIGGVATPGSKEVCSGKTTTFLMTAVGPGGQTDYSLTVSVSPGQLANLPNLVIESIVFEPNPCYRGQGCKVRVKVRNDGSAAAEHFIVRWSPAGDEIVPVEWDVDQLGVDEDKTLVYNWLPNQAKDDWRTTATVDIYDEVGEIEEGAANYLEQFITVLEP